MYIKSFHIEGFGPLKDFSVNDIPCGMAVFLGNNEAGKSSAMEFVRAMLMGIPTKRNSLTQNIRSSKGGSMKIHDAIHGDIDLVRNFSTNASLVQLYDAHGNACKESILTEIMGGISRDVYRMIYGFNLLELQNINNFHGSEIFNTILGASFGLGLRGPVAALENIQERMDAIYKTRGKNTTLQKLFDAWNNNKDSLDTAFEEVKQFDILQKERAKLDKNLSILRDEKSGVSRKGEELQSLLAMWGQWEKWFELQNLIANFSPLTVSFPENAELVLERILEQKKIKQKNLEALKTKQNELTPKQEGSQTYNVLIAQHAALKSLMEEKGSYRQALAEFTTITVKGEQFYHVVDDINSRLKEKWQVLDGQNRKLHAFTDEEMANHLAEISRDEVFLNEFSYHESKILEAEAHAQNAITALDYAQRDVRFAKEKREKTEEDIKHILKEEAQAENEPLLSHINTYDTISEQINLSKEANRLLPVTLDRAKNTFEDWKKQIGYLGIRDLDPNFDEENKKLSMLTDGEKIGADKKNREDDEIDENSEIPFTIISKEKDRNYYTHASNIIRVILEQRERILPIAQRFLDEEELSRELAEKMEHTANQRIDSPSASQNTDANTDASTDALDTNSGFVTGSLLHSVSQSAFYAETTPITDKYSIEIKDHALQKLQTVDELRAKSILRLGDLHAEHNMLDASLEDKKISKIAMVPGVLCLGLGLPLLGLRLFSGQNIITLDAIQSIISFAEIFPSWAGSIYVPLWLPLVLTFIAMVSIYLPASRKSGAQDEQRRLDEVNKKIDGVLDNLTALKRNEALIVSRIFNISEEQQIEYYEMAKANLANALESDFPQILDMAIIDDIALKEDTLGENLQQNEESLILNEKILPMKNKVASNISLSLSLEEMQEIDEEAQEVDEDVNSTKNHLGEDVLSQELQEISNIIKSNIIYREVSKLIQQDLQGVLGIASTHPVVEGQPDYTKIQNEEKHGQFLREKQQAGELFNESRALLYSYRMEWEKFFQKYFFDQIPEPKDMEAFFLRIEACANVQKRLLELNIECHTYNQHIADFQKTSQSDFPEVYEDLYNVFNEDGIHLSQVIEEIEKHIQGLRLSLLRGKDTAVQEATLETAIQTEKQARVHMAAVEENLRERQDVVDAFYAECVSFLCKCGILSSHDAGEYFAKMLGELSEIDELGELGDIGDIDTLGDPIKKINLSLVKQLIEIMERFDNTMIEYDKIKTNIFGAEDIIADFESFLKELMEEAEFTPLFDKNDKLDYLASFEQFYAKIEQEIAKNKNKENIELQHEQVGKEVEAVQMDLDEIQSNIEGLLDLAKVQSESQLRELIEAQKQRDQIVHSSLALEEPFRSASLPKRVGKSMKPCKRKYKEDAARNIEKLPEIFDYFDEMAKQVWQKELSDSKKSYELLEAQEHEIQNNCGVFQAKCDALVQSATLAHFRREQLEIEERIEEAYERWLELSFTKQVVTKARKQYEQDKQPKVIEMASDFFATITDNAWEKVVVSIDDKNIKVVGKNGAPVSPEVLSQGTREQLYLALRLAHIQNRAQDQQYMPILMDDILVNFDKNRMENTIETLSKLIVPRNMSGQGVSAQITPMQSSGQSPKQAEIEKQGSHKTKKSGTERISKNKKIDEVEHGQQILFYTCHEDTAQMLQDKIAQTKIYLVENKTVRPA